MTTQAFFGILKELLFSHCFSAFFFLLLSSLAQASSSEYTVDIIHVSSRGYRFVNSCQAKGANFGSFLLSPGYGGRKIGCIISTDPVDACFPVTKLRRNLTDCKYYYASVPEGGCSSSEKAYEVQEAGYDALILYSEPGEQPTLTLDENVKERVTIPVLKIAYDCAHGIMTSYVPNAGYRVRLRTVPRYYSFTKFGIFFFGTSVVCIAFLLISMAARLYQQRKHGTRKRLSKKKLKKLPTRKCGKCDTLITCAICLDDFTEGEKLRILPCNHFYHTKCVDPWLTKNRSVCPLCKQNVYTMCRSHFSESDEEETTIRSIEDRLLNACVSQATAEHDSERPMVIRRTPRRNDESPISDPRPFDSADLRQKISPLVEVLKDGATRELNVGKMIFDKVSQLGQDENASTSTYCTSDGYTNNIPEEDQVEQTRF